MQRSFVAFLTSAVCTLTLASAAAAVPGVRVSVDADRAVQTVRPLEAMGSTVDKEPMGSIPRLYSQRNVDAMLGAGLGWLSYRLFTELSSQDWHWNPRGSFSQGDRGYWTSASDTNGPLINDSYQYALEHRGSTTDQGNSASYSRIDDGDPATYWKSNPYLTAAYTHESDALHPQWVVVDLERVRAVNTVRISWGDPYARRFVLSYWTGSDPFGDPANGRWIAFSNGTLVHARFVRVLMSASSNTCDTHGSSDPRNCVGYAIREIAVGVTSGSAFTDYVRHIPGQKQTPITVSSVDPWHTAASKVLDQEQPGLDLIARSGLTRNFGGTYPVAMLYSTPANAVAEVRYLRARGYSIRMIELGEEPDGQYVTPEDDAALYVQFAHALHAYDPSLKLGGPVFSGTNDDVQAWPDASGNVSWLNRWLHYLNDHHAMNELAFFSFEHYPFDGCMHGAQLRADLVWEPSLVRHIVSVWRNDGVPPSIPMYVTEANFSAVNFTQTPMQIEGGLWLADYFASALSSGVSGVVYYQYEPVPLSRNAQCPSDWGNLTMFVAGDDAKIRARAAQYGAAQMLTQQWAAPGDDPHTLYRATTTTNLVSAYALRRPDSTWSVLLVNKDVHAHGVAIDVRERGEVRGFTGTITRASFGPAQYVWHARGAASLPDPDAPPEVTKIPAAPSYDVPAQTIVVLRGTLGPPAVAIKVDTKPAHRLAVIRPLQAIGTAVDSDPPGKVPLLYSKPRVDAMLASGLGTISYRLYTELSIEDWHWNPVGAFSDASRQQGYWTSSATPAGPIVDSWGYRLPHRGSTHDQGDDDDYSRIDDGDPTTYWKSNPYLTSAYTHEPDGAHPQWVAVDLGAAHDVDAMTITWVDPYATTYRLQYWRGAADAINDPGNGVWVDFPHGAVANARTGTVATRVADAPLSVRWVRVLMTASSNTCDSHGAGDPRNCAGYAIADIGVGTLGANGTLVDLVARGKDKKQTAMWTSSDDPWHAASDVRTSDQDQPGLDIVSTSGITRGLPMLYPVPLFYSTPQNAANEVRYLEARHYPIAGIEMGEEIDGQYATPEDYGALYIQFADAVHAVYPQASLGGPVFSGFNNDWPAWHAEGQDASWFRRFLDYLRSRGRSNDLAFMSFEHYPFHACDAGDQLQDDLLREPQLMRDMVKIFRDDGLAPSVPMYVTESNFSSDGGPDPNRIEGALWTSDWIASALSGGITGINYYQFETEPVDQNKRCGRPGTYTLFDTAQDYTIRGPGANFYAAQMLTQQWLRPGNAPHELFPVTTSLGSDRPLVTAYAARLPDGTWSLLFVNKDWSARRVRIDGLGAATSFAWFGDPARGIARVSRDDVLSQAKDGSYILPARSIDVIRF